MSVRIETKSLTKIYQSNGASAHALRGIDFKVANGEFVALMGPSGCGKSTLLHILGGLDSPTSGEIYLDGTRLDNQSESKLAIMRRKKIGVVFQFFNLIGNLSIADNIELPAMLIGRSPGERRHRRNELLTQLGIADKANLMPARLSGGEQQRVAIARALMNEPSVLLADEPTGNLDSKNGAEVVKLLHDFHTRGQTVVLVTHDPHVASMAERIVFLGDGMVMAEMNMGSQRGHTDLVLQKLAELEV